jgi:type VI secretion system FHA domain protein
MALRLRIISDNREIVDGRGSIMFGVGGGSLGRSADNDWVLPDPSRFLSGHHARIHFRHGSFYIEDTSTNGTYLNDAADPIPRATPCELHNGDLLRIGDYQVSVAIDGVADDPAERTAGVTLEEALLAEPLPHSNSSMDAVRVTPAHADAARAAHEPPQVEGHLGDSLSASSLFRKEPSVSDEFNIGNAFGQAVVLPFAASREPGPRASDSSDVISARRMERLQRAAGERDGQAARETAPRAPRTTAREARHGLELLCRGAGIEPGQLQADAAGAILQLAGQLLREAVVGLRDLNLRQTELAREYALGPLRPEGESERFDLQEGADELIVKLLASHDSRRLDAGHWLRQTFEQVGRHETALAGSSRTALLEFMSVLEPGTLEERFERSAKRNLMGARITNWELYKELYRSLMEVPSVDGVPHTFAEAFANAYQAALHAEKPD